MASSSDLQQAESFSSMDEKVKPQSPRTTACVQINETPSSSEAGKDEPYICRRCEDIDLPDLFSSQNPPMHLSFKHGGEFDLDPECGICRLLRLSWLNPSSNPRSPRTPVYSLGSWSERARCFFMLGEHDRFGMIQEVPSAAISNFVAAKIDFTVLKSWIEDCTHNHGPECAATWNRDSIRGLKLIKIKERRIVNASQEGGPYAALSYVWGTGAQGSPQGDKLPAEMPKTIVDAMNVALELDLEYLWVDRYCIQQDDPEEKKDQIRKMHHIYRQSHVTIIAAAGDGPNHGIPGMSIPRTPPAYTALKGRAFIGFIEFNRPLEPATDSKWHTRAWTYQEQILSRRLIVFTDSQSFFHCNLTQVPWTFAVEEPIRNVVMGEDCHLNCDLASELEKDTSNSYVKGLLHIHILELDYRNLTYESDRVNTIAGILGRLQDQGVIVGHLSGSPILRERFNTEPRTIMSWEEGFLSGTAVYRSFKESDRRKEFPSWSWAGWKDAHLDLREVFVREYDLRIWIELDATVTSILNSVDDVDVPKPLVSNICLTSKEFQKIAQRLIFKDSTCRFIRIEAPIIHCQLKICDYTGHRIVGAVEGFQVRQVEWKVSKVHFASRVDRGSDQERELLSSPLKGLFMRMEYYRKPRGYVVLVKELDEYFELLACWLVDPVELPVLLQVRDEEGSIRPLFNYHPEEKPETEILLKKEIIRLG